MVAWLTLKALVRAESIVFVRPCPVDTPTLGVTFDSRPFSLFYPPPVGDYGINLRFTTYHVVGWEQISIDLDQEVGLSRLRSHS